MQGVGWRGHRARVDGQKLDYGVQGVLNACDASVGS